jgi:hypothetical protein
VSICRECCRDHGPAVSRGVVAQEGQVWVLPGQDPEIKGIRIVGFYLDPSRGDEEMVEVVNPSRVGQAFPLRTLYELYEMPAPATTQETHDG